MNGARAAVLFEYCRPFSSPLTDNKNPSFFVSVSSLPLQQQQQLSLQVPGRRSSSLSCCSFDFLAPESLCCFLSQLLCISSNRPLLWGPLRRAAAAYTPQNTSRTSQARRLLTSPCSSIHSFICQPSFLRCVHSLLSRTDRGRGPPGAPSLGGFLEGCLANDGCSLWG